MIDVSETKEQEELTTRIKGNMTNKMISKEMFISEKIPEVMALTLYHYTSLSMYSGKTTEVTTLMQFCSHQDSTFYMHLLMLLLPIMPRGNLIIEKVE